MIPVEQFWKNWHKGLYRDEYKTLVLVETSEGPVQEFAFVMNGFFDHFRQGCSFKKDSIKFVLVKNQPKI
jgi:hypothetical protein